MENRNSATVVIQPPNSTLTIGLGVSLGVALLLLVIIAVVLCIAICKSNRSRKSASWHYFTNTLSGKRKHHNVRYSKRHQNPLQFTFAQDEGKEERENSEDPTAPDDDEIGGLIGFDSDS